MTNIFYDIGIIIIFATILGYIGRLLKQPLIPLYILAGVIIGPVGLGWITDTEVIRTLSEIGVAFLLFIVGLELDLRKLKDVGKVVLIGSTIQILTMFTAGVVIGMWTGFAGKELIYIGLIVSFSSTMVVIKLLADKNELDTLHGRIVIGILLMEDLFAIIALSSLQTISNFSAALLAASILKVFGLIALVYISGKFIFPIIFKVAARSQEILFLIAITVCFSFGMLGAALELSIAIGAFLAGVSLANLPYNLEIESKVRSLRDFFSTIFFVSLGMKLMFTNVSQWIIPLIMLTLLITIFKPTLITTILSVFGYKRKTAFMTSAVLAQTSEFSLIIIAQGAILGHISNEFLSITTLLATITITASTYFIKFDSQIYEKTKGYLKIFEKLSKNNKELTFMEENPSHKVVLIGYDRMGYSIGKTLKQMNKDFLIVDFNPDIVKRLIKTKQPCIYGDAGDIEILEKLKLNQVEMVISTIPDANAAELLIKKIRNVNKHAIIIVTSMDLDDALELYDQGADYVIIPHLLGGNHMSIMLEDISYDLDKLINTKILHIKELKERKEVHHHK
ncbi:MAG: cation:proton antiporter [Nanoarchaeota archaeon]|nr:cation:proton antiporter [Nanoarchaeota archaeon]MBU1855289.1 cation:proton antiporter [Nanoarchaeota archaeon]